MSTNRKGHLRNHTLVIKVGAWAFILAAFLYPLLTLNSNIPEIFQGAAVDVLPRLNELGKSSRVLMVWFSLAPLALLIPAAFGAMEALKRDQRIVMEFAFILLVLGAFGLSLGIMRWSALNWQMGMYYTEDSNISKYWVEQTYEFINTYFGIFIGEFLAEIAIYSFVIITSLVVIRSPRMPRWVGVFGLVVAAFGIMSTMRHSYEIGESFYEVTQILKLLPIWMVIFGIGLLRIKVNPSDRVVKLDSVEGDVAKWKNDNVEKLNKIEPAKKSRRCRRKNSAKASRSKK